MSFVESLVVKHVKLSSINEADLTRKRVSLSDSISFTKSIVAELEADVSRNEIVDTIAVLVMLTSLVSDVIRDSVGETLSKADPRMKFGLTRIYDKAREQKWKGSKYEKDIDAIKTNGGYLESLAELEKTGMLKMVANIHKNMTMNIVGLVGYAEDARDIKAMLLKSVKSLKDGIKALELERERVDFYLRTGDGGPAPRFSTPASAGIQVAPLG